MLSRSITDRSAGAAIPASDKELLRTPNFEERHADQVQDAGSLGGAAPAAPGTALVPTASATAVEAPYAALASPSAVGLNAAHGPAPANSSGASQGQARGGLDEAHLPLALTMGNQDEVVNVTFASPLAARWELDPTRGLARA